MAILATLDLCCKYITVFVVPWLICLFAFILDEKLYNELLENWFPENGKPPSAFLLDTSEEALLLPDLLKLRMIRSSSEQLITAGKFLDRTGYSR